ncbi:protein MMS22-like [Clytia hemisphaerica]
MAEDCHLSGSETESLSDSSESTETYFDTKYYFDCSAKDELSFLKNGCLKLLVNFNQKKPWKSIESSELFGRTFFFHLSDELSDLVSVIRFGIYQVINAASNPAQINASLHGFAKQLNIKGFNTEVTKTLFFILANLESIEEDDLNKTLIFVKEFNNLILSVGSLISTPRWNDHKIKSDAIYHLFHLRLKLKVFFLLYLVVLRNKVPDNNILNKTFEKNFDALTFELLIASNIKFSKLLKRNEDFSSESCSLCSCMKESWVIMLQISKHNSYNTTNKTFWTLITQHLQESHQQAISSLQKRWNFQWHGGDDFQTWLLTSLAPLYWISGDDGENMFELKQTVPDSWQSFQDMIQRNKTDERKLQTILWGCHRLAEHWQLNIAIYNSLLDIFYQDIVNKKDNKRTRQKKTLPSITNYMRTSEDLSITHQLSILKQFNKPMKSLQEIQDETPFETFLRFVSATVQKAVHLEAPQISQIKQRVYSKFHKKCIADLDLQGIENLFQLLLVIGLGCNTIDVMMRIPTLLNHSDFQQKSIAFKKQYLTQHFILLMIYKERSMEIKTLVNRILVLFKNLIVGTSHQKCSKEQYQQNLNILSFYFELVQQYYDENCYIQEADLILLNTNIYNTLLRTLPEHHSITLYNHIARVILVFVQSYDSIKEKAFTVLYETFHDQLYNTLSCLNQQNQQVVGKFMDIFASLTMLALKSESADAAETLISRYAFTEDISLSARCLFITKLISLDSYKTFIEQKQELFEKHVTTWISCVLMGLGTQLFTKQLSKYTRVSQYLLQPRPPDENDCFAWLVLFIENLGRVFSNAPTPTDALTLKLIIGTYFGSLVKLSEPVLSESTDLATMKRLYDVTSCLVRKCTKALYSKTSPNCLLPQIIDSFILPICSSKKPLPEKRKEFIFKYLHLFLNGISSMDLKRDGFIARRIREITNRYFTDISIAHFRKKMEKNPFLMSLGSSCVANPNQPSRDYRSLFLTHIKSNYTQLPQDHQKLTSTLSFLLQLVSATKNEDELCATLEIFIGRILYFILSCDNVKKSEEPPHIRDFSKNILKNISRLTKADSHQRIQNEMLQFVKVHINRYSEVPLKVMETVCIAHSPSVTNIYRKIEQIAMDEENRKGNGVDHELRNALKKLNTLVEAMRKP